MSVWGSGRPSGLWGGEAEELTYKDPSCVLHLTCPIGSHGPGLGCIPEVLLLSPRLRAGRRDQLEELGPLPGWCLESPEATWSLTWFLTRVWF